MSVAFSALLTAPTYPCRVPGCGSDSLTSLLLRDLLRLASGISSVLLGLLKLLRSFDRIGVSLLVVGGTDILVYIATHLIQSFLSPVCYPRNFADPIGKRLEA
jgi:hypothetical protein